MNGETPEIRIIEFPAQDRRTSVNSSANITSSSTVPHAVVADGLRVPALFSNRWSCRSETAALAPGATDTNCEYSNAKYLGYEVWSVQTRVGVPPNHVVLELLLAPTLDWHWLQRTVRRGKDGAVLGIVKAVNVIEAEPDRTLFEIPRTAKSVSPKEFSRSVRPTCRDCKNSLTRDR